MEYNGITVENKRTLREHRRHKGWTQTELSRRSGVSNVRISLYEKGDSIPSGPALQRLAVALEVDANDILLLDAKAA